MTTYADALAQLQATLITGAKGSISPETVATVVQGVTDALLAEMTTDETSIVGKMAKSANLSDVASKATAAANLNIGATLASAYDLNTLTAPGIYTAPTPQNSPDNSADWQVIVGANSGATEVAQIAIKASSGAEYRRTYASSAWSTWRLIYSDASSPAQRSVLSMTTAVPTLPTVGDRYIVPVSATGAWSGKDNQVATYYITGWGFATPAVGWQAYVTDLTARYEWNGSAWALPSVTSAQVSDATTLGRSLMTAASAAAARTATNVESYTGHGDSNYSMLATDRTVGTTAAFTASRTWTLPAANAVNPGAAILVADYFGGVTGTNTLVVQRAGSDTINGSTSITITSAFGQIYLESDGVSKWTAAPLGTAAGGLLAANNLSDVANGITARSNLDGSPFAAMAWNNLVINGAMDVAQKNGNSGVALATGTEQYPIDQWTAKFVRAATLALSAAQTTSGLAGIPNFLYLQASTGLTTLATGDYAYLSAPIEGYRAAKLGYGAAGAQSITISFWVNATITGTASVAITNSANNRSYVANFTVNNAATWEYKTVTIPGDVAGTWLTTSGIGLRAIFCCGCGSTFQGTAGAWSASQIFGTSSNTNFMATTNNTFGITGVSIFAGSQGPTSALSPNAQLPFDIQLPLCQRYYNKLGGASAVFPALLGAAYTGTAVIGNLIAFPVPMRATPTLTKAGTWTVSNCGQPSFANPSTLGCNMSVAGTGSGNLSAAPTDATTYLEVIAQM